MVLILSGMVGKHHKDVPPDIPGINGRRMLKWISEKQL
jgi:hypothetical protein